MTHKRNLSILRATLFSLLVFVPSAHASVIAIVPGDFPASSTLITFTGVAADTEVNGLFTAGVTFAYNLGNNMLTIDGGPGTTNNVDDPNVVSIGDNSGILTVTLPGFVNSFGFGYAVLSTLSVSNATTLTLFNGATNVGSLAYDASPDPFFAGGFAGIQSTIPFNRVAIVFESTSSLAFALDNVRFSSSVVSPVPEPSTVLLLLAGAAVIFYKRH